METNTAESQTESQTVAGEAGSLCAAEAEAGQQHVALPREADSLTATSAAKLVVSRTFKSAPMEQLHTPLVIVPKGWKPSAGKELNSELKIGKVLGTGYMGAVYDIRRNDGSDARRVLKALRVGATEEMRELLEREMVIGRLLSEALITSNAAGNPTIPGYMYIQAAVREENAEGKLQGIVIEKVNSMDVFKRLNSFGRNKPMNVQYIQECIRQTLTALKKGRESIGFHHRDLHAENIMEQLATAKDEDASAAPAVDMLSEMKKGQVKLSRNGWKYRIDPDEAIWHDLDKGHELKIEFKIIDYGWAVAEAVDEKEVNDLLDVNNTTTAVGCGRCFCCMVKPKSYDEAKEAKSPKHVSNDNPKANPFAGNKIPELKFSAKLYHKIWKGSSDCFRLLSSLAAICDDRLWHASDKAEVKLLADLLFRCSGVHIRMRFTDKDESNDFKAKKYGVAWQARQLMRMGRNWFNMGWALAFPTDPNYPIEAALGHPFLTGKLEVSAAPASAGVSPQQMEVELVDQDPN